MRRVRLFACLFLGGLAAASLTQAAAQSPAAPAAPAAAPGAGHGFLIDKHVAAGLHCASCHSENPPAAEPAQAVCTNCHGTYAQIAAKTAADQPNPHASHLGGIPCSACHHVHKVSVLYCAQCHNFDLQTP